MSRNLRTVSIQELQNFGISGDDDAIYELGRRMLNMPIHEHGGDFYCRYKFELDDLNAMLDMELPLECPHCGGWLTDV